DDNPALRGSGYGSGHPIPILFNQPTECDPTEFRVLDHVGARIDGVTIEPTAIIARIAVISQGRRIRMECGGAESIGSDIGQCAHGPGMANAEQVEIVGMVPVV